jgi:hypothetical protein
MRCSCCSIVTEQMVPASWLMASSTACSAAEFSGIHKRSSSERKALAHESEESLLEREGRLGQEGKAYAAPISLEKDDLRGWMSRSESLGVGGGAKGLDMEEEALPLQAKVGCAGSVLAIGAAALGSDISWRRD